MQMKKIFYVTLTAGLLLFIGLIVREGVPEILTALSVAGWGLILIAIIRIIPIALDAIGWSALFNKLHTPPLLALSWARWIGESINTLLPVAQVGGNVVRAKLVTRYGVEGIRAAAIAVVELTIGLVTQLLFAFAGGFFLLQHSVEGFKKSSLMLGLIACSFILMVFYLTQRSGLFGYFARFFKTMAKGKDFVSLVGNAKSLDMKVEEIYRKNREAMVCGFWKLLAWITRTGETWLAFYLLGFPVTLQEALIVESLSSVVRVSAFAVPVHLVYRKEVSSLFAV